MDKRDFLQDEIHNMKITNGIVMRKTNSSGRLPLDETESTTKIAMILNSDFSLDSQGGVETYVKELSHSLEKKGRDIWKIGILDPEREILQNEIIIAKKRVSNYLFLLLLFKVVFRIRKESGFVIHVHRPEQLVPFFFVKKNNVALISSVHGPARTGIIEGKGRFIGAVYSLLEFVGLRIADSIIFVDKKTLEDYLNSFPWLKRKSRVIPAGISNDFLNMKISRKEALAQFNFNENEKIICFIGRLEHEKNVHVIIGAFAKIANEEPELRLAIAGDGVQMKALRRLASDLKISHKIKFLGMISHTRVRQLLSASEALIMASKFEGSPLVARESLAIGTRVVSTDIGDVSELIKNENFGYIIPETTEDALAKGISKILRSDRKRIGKSTFKDLNWDTIADRTIELYDKSMQTIRYH